VLQHLAGLCHVYVHAGADLAMARAVVMNAKLRRVGVCGAAETLLVDQAVAASHLVPILQDLAAAGCEIRGIKPCKPCSPPHPWPRSRIGSTEYLAPIIAVRVVADLAQAVAHINHYGSHHTDSIITDDPTAAAAFLAQVDSAMVLHNASTQFADGGSLGLARKSALRQAACTPAARRAGTADHLQIPPVGQRPMPPRVGWVVSGLVGYLNKNGLNLVSV
jgi:glutamate-5-semialdehyde dehydrogenase